MISRMQVTQLFYSPAYSHNWCCILHPSPSAGGRHGRGCVCQVGSLSLTLVKTLCSPTLGQAEMESILEEPILEEPCASALCHHTDAVGGHKEPKPKSTKEEPDQNLGSTGSIRRPSTGHLKTCSHYSVYI